MKIIINDLTVPRLHFRFSASKVKALHWSSMKEQIVPHIVLDLALEFSFFRSNKLSQAQLWNSLATNISRAVAVRISTEVRYYKQSGGPGILPIGTRKI